MAEIRTVTTLTHKRHQIESAIENYKQRLDQARADLAHVNAVITLFEVNDDAEMVRPYTDIHRLYKRGEMIALCKEALAQGPMTTRELAIHIMKHKGLDDGDKVLAKAIAYRLIHALRQQCRRGLIGDGGKRGNVRVWSAQQRVSPLGVLSET